MAGADTPENTRRGRVERTPHTSVINRPVTVVQEVLSSGLSAAYVQAWLLKHGATSVDICTLLDRDVARVLDVPVALRGFAAPDVTLAGFGLSRWDEFRDLPHVAQVMAEEVCAARDECAACRTRRTMKGRIAGGGRDRRRMNCLRYGH